MLDALMKFGLKNRLIVVLSAISLLVVGVYTIPQIPVDVFPDLTAPTVSILTEAHGMAPEEIEVLVTFPVETAVNGASGVRRVRSNSIQGLSIVWVEFEWGTEIYTARQIVTERLKTLQNLLPEGVDQPALAPITSIMGEIMLIGLTSEKTSMMELRTLADFTIRPRLQSIPGTAQVLVYGGETKQYQIQIDPYLLLKHDLAMQEVLDAVSDSNVNATGGIFTGSGQEYLIRGIGRARSIDDLEFTVVGLRNGVSILLRDIATVVIAPATRIGTASINMESGVMLVISKQPDANTLVLTRNIEEAIEKIKPDLPEDVTLHSEIFKQADFINVAIRNMVNALFYGAILVVLVLFIFLTDIRTTAISVTAIPLSLVVSFLVLKSMGMSINTMTLGGMAIAIGVLVDDAIIYVENVYRRIRENGALPPSQQRDFMSVVLEASAEIKRPIAMASPIVIIVFIPFFFLQGMEGRMLKPLGLAYVVSIFASLIVALTVTPALSSYLLRKIPQKKMKDSWLVGGLKRHYLFILERCIQRKAWVIGLAGVMVVGTISCLPFMGRSFLPEFNEGTLNISLATVPGTSLEESDKIGEMTERILLEHPAVLTTARRTGRTEMDEHSMGSHGHEMEVRIDLSKISKKDLLSQLRRSLSIVPGTIITIGQPISHRIDHMLSGTRANIAVKIFGPDLHELRNIAEQVKSQMENVEGIVDLSVGQQTDIPQVRIQVNRRKMALYGLRPADVDEMIDIAFLGVTTSQIFEPNSRHDLVVRYAPEHRGDLDAIRNSLIDTPQGTKIPLEMVSDISVETGPNYIGRENVQRKIVVQANVAERDLRSVVEETTTRINRNVRFPQGYYVEFGGQFESEKEATRMVTLLSFFSVLSILVILYLSFGNFRQAILVMVNLPLALIGGFVSIYLTEGVITIASLVGFITLFGIAVRNGSLMVAHYNYLMDEEGKTLQDAVLQGSLERLSPVLMTALTTSLALIPLALGMDKPGSEIQSPMSIVILGGLVTATFLNLIFAAFEKYPAFAE